MPDPAGVHHTARLVLRPVTLDSVADVVDLHRDPGIAEWYEGPWSSRRAGEFAADMADRWRRDGLGKWLVYERGSGELIGRGGPSRTDAFGGDDVEIGWAVRQRYWGQGFGTEIGRACLHFVTATVDPPVIFAFTEAHNHRSRAVMVRLGMTYSNEIRGYGYVEGRDGVHHDAPFAVYRRDRASSDVSTSR